MPVRFRLDEVLEASEPPLSQSELARQSGVSRETVNAMVKNRTAQVSLDTLDKLCGVLGIEPGALLVREAPRNRRR